MSSSQNYTTVQQFGPRKFDAVYIRSGEVVERSSYVTLSEAEHQARGLEIIGVPYRPVQPARGGFDRTATQTPEPVDVEVPMPGLLPESEEQTQDDDQERETPLNHRRRALGLCDIEDEASLDADDSVISGFLPRWQTPAARETFWDEMSAQPDVEEPQAQPQKDDDQAPDPPTEIIDALRQAALEAGHDAGRVDRAVGLVTAGHVFDAGVNGEWIVFSEAVKNIQPADFDWTPGPGKAPPAERYVTAPQPVDSQRSCDCPDASHRLTGTAGKCKHQLAAIMAANLRRRLGDPALYAYPA